MQDFKGKTVIITGASAGVGEACAKAFANEGANLVLVARGQAGLDAVEKALSPLTQVKTLALDIGESGACDKLIAFALEQFGNIHVLINNAGAHFRGDVVKRSSKELASMVDINLRAPIEFTAAALLHIQKEGGAIVMVGSLAGRAPLQGAATYSATKAGLRTFAHALADELRGSNVAVGVVSPGPIDTGFIMDEIDNVEDIVYSQPMSTAEQVAEAVMKIARGEEVEIAMPAMSGTLTTFSYLFPTLRRAARPTLYKIGRKNKNKYRNRK